MIRTGLRRFVPVLFGSLATLLLLAIPSAQATNLNNQTLTQLISESQSIIAGTVKTVELDRQMGRCPEKMG